MNNRALAAEAFGTFMLMSAVLGSAFYSFGAPSGAAGILGVAFSIGITVMVTAFAIGHVSGGHYNPAVTLGLVAGGRFELGKARYYILAQVIGACAACGIFSLVGHPSATFAANGYGELSMLKASLFEVFILETVLTAFFLVVIGVTRANGPALARPGSHRPDPDRDPYHVDPDLQYVGQSGPEPRTSRSMLADCLCRRSGCSGWHPSSAASSEVFSANGWSKNDGCVTPVGRAHDSLAQSLTVTEPRGLSGRKP